MGYKWSYVSDVSVVTGLTFFLRFFQGPLKKRDFRENATGKKGPDFSFAWCLRGVFVAIIKNEVGKHAGACAPAFPEG